MSADHISAEACRRLWQALLLDQLSLLLREHDPVAAAKGRASVEVLKAQAWFGSRDFAMVCALAGLDPVAVASTVRQELARPVAQRAISRVQRKGRPCGYGRAGAAE